MLLLAALGVLPFIVGLLARVAERSWVAPATFFALLWGAVALPAGLVFSEEPGIYHALIWIFLSSSAVLLGSLTARPYTPWHLGDRLRVGAVRGELPLLWLPAAIAVVAGIGELLFLFQREGFSVLAVLSYAAIAQLTAANRSNYIYGDVQQGTGEALAFLLLYAGTLFGGLLFRLRRTRSEGMLGVAPVALILVVFGLYGSRMGALYGGSFWVAAYLAGTILVGNHGDVVGWRFLLRVGLLAGFLGFGFSVGTQILRYSTSASEFDWRSMLGDGVSFVAAFGIWFKDHVALASDFFWGGRVFRRFVAPLGIDYPLAPAIDVGFTSSNIYTVLRDLIEDFGSFGALLFLFCYGFISRWLFARVVQGSVQGVGALALVFAFALTSVAFSIFSYTTTSAAALGFVFYCLLAPSLARGWFTHPEPLRQVPAPPTPASSM